jgi:hypothetical protein
LHRLTNRDTAPPIGSTRGPGVAQQKISLFYEDIQRLFSSDISQPYIEIGTGILFIMSADWTSFGVILLTQAVFLLLSAIYYKRMNDLPRLLCIGIIIGTFVGLLYDNVLGKHLGLFSYQLGFGTTFLLLNASLSYGLFITSVLLVQKVSVIKFTIWMSILIVIYEVINVFFPVWSYNFSLPLLPFFIICLVGYSSGALLASLITKYVFKRPFALEVRR